MRRKFIFISFPILLLVGIYFLGPTPSKPTFSPVMPVVPQEPNALEKYVATNESKHKTKPDNEARIIWADSSKAKTKFSVVYLHGFYASQEEGDPVHENFAKKFGCNLFLARLADHGVDTVEQMINFTNDRAWASAKEALAIGKVLGEKVIVMSTSTGGTLGLMLAAEYPEDVFALINMSPNIRINHPLAFIANDPWGLQIARLVRGGKYNVSPPDSVLGKYWYQKFRLEAVVQLQELLEEKMNESTFKKIKCPSLTLYYYKNEQEQDPTVKVSAMLEMNKQLATPDSMKEAIAIPGAGGHVMGSHLVSKDIPAVKKEIENFCIEKLGMEKVITQYEIIDNEFAQKPFTINPTPNNIRKLYLKDLSISKKTMRNIHTADLDTVIIFAHSRDSICFVKTKERVLFSGALIFSTNIKLQKNMSVGIDKSEFIKRFNVPEEFRKLNLFSITTATGYCKSTFKFYKGQLVEIYVDGCID